MSTLVVKDGAYECTGDQLTYWKQEFKKFDAMTELQQKEYLENIADQTRFFEMHSNRNNLSCGFSTKMVSMSPTYSEKIPDPMIVGRMERSLGRKLTDEELDRIPTINFPDDVR